MTDDDKFDLPGEWEDHYKEDGHRAYWEAYRREARSALNALTSTARTGNMRGLQRCVLDAAILLCDQEYDDATDEMNAPEF